MLHKEFYKLLNDAYTAMTHMTHMTHMPPWLGKYFWVNFDFSDGYTAMIRKVFLSKFWFQWNMPKDLTISLRDHMFLAQANNMVSSAKFNFSV